MNKSFNSGQSSLPTTTSFHLDAKSASNPTKDLSHGLNHRGSMIRSRVDRTRSPTPSDSSSRRVPPAPDPATERLLRQIIADKMDTATEPTMFSDPKPSMASPEYVLKLLHPRGITIRPAGTIPLSAGILRELLGNPTDAEVREKLKSVYIPDNADELREDLTTMLRAIANKGEWERSIYEKYYLLDNRASGHGHKRIVLPTYQAKDNVNSNIAFPLPLTFNRSLSGIPISNEIFFRDPQSGDTGIQTLFPDHHYVYRPDPKTPLASLTPFRALPAFRSGARLGGALISGPPYFLHKSKADATAGSLSAAENYIALLASGILLERLWLLYFTVPEGEPIILANEFPFIYLMISCGNLIRLYQADVRWPYDASGRLSRDLNPNGKTEVRFDVQTLLYTCDLLLPSDISILREWLNLIHYYGATLHYQWLDQLAARAVTDPRLQGRAWTDLISDHCFVYRHDGIHLRRRKEKLQGGGQRASSKAESQRSAKRKVDNASNAPSSSKPDLDYDDNIVGHT